MLSIGQCPSLKVPQFSKMSYKSYLSQKNVSEHVAWFEVHTKYIESSFRLN